MNLNHRSQQTEWKTLFILCALENKTIPGQTETKTSEFSTIINNNINKNMFK